MIRNKQISIVFKTLLFSLASMIIGVSISSSSSTLLPQLMSGPVIASATTQTTRLAAVQSPRLAAFKALSSPSITINQGTKYKLPATLAVLLSDNTKRSLPVRWTSNNLAVDTKQVGTKSILGIITTNSWSKQIRLTIKIIPYITTINDVSITIKQYESFRLPEAVAAIYSDGTTAQASVNWQTSQTDLNTDKEGSHTFLGSVSSNGLKINFALNLNVLPVKPTAILAENGALTIGFTNAPTSMPEPGDFIVKCIKQSASPESSTLQISAIAPVSGDSSGTSFKLSFPKLAPAFEDRTYSFTVSYKQGSNLESNSISILTLVSQTDAFDPKISDQPQFYRAVKYALANYLDAVELEIKNYSDKVYNLDMVDRVLYENPEIDYSYYACSSSVGYSSTSGYSKYTLKIRYKLTKAKMLEEKKAAESKADEIVNQLVQAGMSDYQKELALHDYIVNHANYDELAFKELEPIESHNSYGVLVLGTGVCESYAKAFALLLSKAGIENRYVVGDAIDSSGTVGHAWNMVKLDNEWYNVDPTWDDPSEQDGSSRLTHEYFNVTDQMISKDHKSDQSLTDFPDCYGTKYYFYNQKSIELDRSGKPMVYVASLAEFSTQLSNALSQRESSISFVLLNCNSYNTSASNALDLAYDHSFSFHARYSEAISPIDSNLRFTEYQFTY